MADTIPILTPLSWSTPIVDKDGRPSNEFMQKWRDLQKAALLIPTLSTPAQVSALLDVLAGTEGDLLRRGASLWAALAYPNDDTVWLDGQGAYTRPPLAGVLADGFMPVLSGAATDYLDGSGNWSVPGGGGGGGDFTKLDEVVTAGGAATVSFAGISGAYRSLRLDYTAKSTDTGNDDISMSFQVNGDAGANYAYVRSFLTAGIAGGQSTGQTNIAITQITTNKGSNNAADFDSGTFDFINYADAAKWRHVNCNASNTNGSSSPRFMVGSGRWQNTAAAISSIVFSLAAGNFVNGSVFSLYGIT